MIQNPVVRGLQRRDKVLGTVEHQIIVVVTRLRYLWLSSVVSLLV